MKCIVLAGGRGDRLWPLSRKNYPKQFISLDGSHSIFQDTIARNMAYCDEFVVVTNREYQFIVENQLKVFQGLTWRLVLEEEARKTTAAILLACLEFPLSEEMMRWLIGQGIDINYVDQYGYTPLLYHAGRMASEKQAIALVKLGADITATQGLDRETVMHVAVKTGNLELVKCLIQAGADAEVTSRSGETPLERAFHWARTFDLIKLAPVAEYLIGIGVPVTDKIRL